MRGEAGGGGGGQDGAGGVRGWRPRGPQQRVPPREGGWGQQVVIRHGLALRSEVIFSGDKHVYLKCGKITFVVLVWMSC